MADEEIVLNGRRVGNDDPEAQEVRRRIAESKRRGQPYPAIEVDDYFEVPFFFWGRTAYHAETYERLKPSLEARRRPVQLPEDFEIDGEMRLPGETDRQYQAYLVYRDLGPDRSIGRLGKVLGVRRAHATQRDWGVRFRWDERCAAYDLEMEAERRRGAQDLIQQQIRTELEHRDTYLRNEWDVVEKGFSVVKEMLNYPVIERESTKISEDGKTIVTIWKPGRWTMATVASLIDALSKIGRLNTGLVTSNAGARQDGRSDDERRREQQVERNAEEEAMHQFASMRAEEAYFQACEEFKEKRMREMGEKRPVPALRAQVAS